MNDNYYLQLALDYFGSAIRDNSREAKIQMGRDIEEYGTDDFGNIDYPA